MDPIEAAKAYGWKTVAKDIMSRGPRCLEQDDRGSHSAGAYHLYHIEADAVVDEAQISSESVLFALLVAHKAQEMLDLGVGDALFEFVPSPEPLDAHEQAQFERAGWEIEGGRAVRTSKAPVFKLILGRAGADLAFRIERKNAATFTEGQRPAPPDVTDALRVVGRAWGWRAPGDRTKRKRKKASNPG